MITMAKHRLPRLAYLVAVSVLAACLGLGAHAADAKGKQKYYFLVYKIELAEGIPAELTEQVRKQVIRSIAKHDKLIEALPADAPDPVAEPKLFARYIKKNKLEPYRVNVEVTDYSHEVDEMPAGRRGQRLTVSISLRTFGETMPVRKMAFGGEGSSTIKMDIGKKLRKRDSRAANHDAIELAVGDALAISLKRLEEAKKKAKKKRRRRKK